MIKPYTQPDDKSTSSGPIEAGANDANDAFSAARRQADTALDGIARTTEDFLVDMGASLDQASDRADDLAHRGADAVRRAAQQLRDGADENLCARGAYTLRAAKSVRRVVLIATGSEVQLALHAQQLLAGSGIAVRVVSMPSTSVFDRQTSAYKTSVLPQGLPRIAVEMGVTDGWWKYGCAAVVGIDTFGESAPAPVLFKHFGFTPENVANTVRKVLSFKR